MVKFKKDEAGLTSKFGLNQFEFEPTSKPLNIFM